MGNNTMNTRRCVDLFVTQGLRPRKANASAKHVKGCRWGIFHESHDLARYCARAHFRASSASAYEVKVAQPHSPQARFVLRASMRAAASLLSY